MLASPNDANFANKTPSQASPVSGSECCNQNDKSVKMTASHVSTSADKDSNHPHLQINMDVIKSNPPKFSWLLDITSDIQQLKQFYICTAGLAVQENKEKRESDLQKDMVKKIELFINIDYGANHSTALALKTAIGATLWHRFGDLKHRLKQKYKPYLEVDKSGWNHFDKLNNARRFAVAITRDKAIKRNMLKRKKVVIHVQLKERSPPWNSTWQRLAKVRF